MARGYVSSAYFLHRAMEALLGPDLVGCSHDDPGHTRMRLHYCPPHYFQPTPGKVDVLFTMWEGDLVPDHYVTRLRAADAIIVPSRYCRDVFAKYDLDATVVPLGIPEEYLQGNCNRPQIAQADREYRVLWVGSTTTRKGYELLEPAWKIVQQRAGVDAWLYVKTIAPLVERRLRRRFDVDHTVVDTRDLEPSAMAKLYQQADVVLSTSYGEGFGLPALEGMALGALACVPFVGGMSDFCSRETAVEIARPFQTEAKYGTESFPMMVPTPETVADAILGALKGWGTPAIENRRRLGNMVARSMTWGSTADRVLDAICEALGKPRSAVFPKHPSKQGSALVVPA